MKTTIFTGAIALFIFAATFSACAQRNRTITRSYEVTDFSAINASIVGNIAIRHGNSFNVRAEGRPDLIDELQVYVENETLFLRMDERLMSGQRIRNRDMPKIEISVPVSNHFEIASYGVSNITSDNIEFATIRIASEGVGNINLRGTADNVYIRLEGVGNVNTERLQARNAAIIARGVGNIRTYASESINIRSEGVGRVIFSGNPATRDVRNEGIGRVRAR